MFKWGASDLTISQMAYKRKIADIDTMTANGTFKWTMIVWDSSMRLITPYNGEFQIVTQGNLSNILDSSTYGAGATDSVIADKSSLADLNIKINSADTIAVALNVANIASTDTLAWVLNVANIPSTDTVAVVNNVLNIASTDTLAVVNNVLNINSADTLALVNRVLDIPSTDTLSVVNNVLNINSADTLALVNRVLDIPSTDTIAVVTNVLNVANIASTDTLAWVLNVANIPSTDTLAVVNNVLNIPSTDTLAVVNNVLNVASTDTLTWVLNVANINSADTLARVSSTDAGDSIRAHAPHDDNWGGTGSSSMTAIWTDTLKTLVHRTDSLMRLSRPDSVRGLLAHNVGDTLTSGDTRDSLFAIANRASDTVTNAALLATGSDADTGIAGLKTRMREILNNVGRGVIVGRGQVIDLGSNSTSTLDIDGDIPAATGAGTSATLVVTTGTYAGTARTILNYLYSGGIATCTFSGQLLPGVPADNDSVVILASSANVQVYAISPGVIDSADIDANVYTYLAGLGADSVWRKGWAFATGTAGTTGEGLDAIRDSMDEASGTGTASPWTASGVDSQYDFRVAISAAIQAIRDSMDEASQTSSACGSGSQSVTIYVLDTSGTDELVPNSYVTIQNSGQTAIMAHGPALSGITGTFGLSASTAYKGIAVANGFYFPLYSFTTGSGASHTDTIRGYDIPTSAGSAVPTSQQVQLYDWAISPANDTLYGAKVTITLAGSSQFYTSNNLVPPASVVVYAGANDGSANGGKWQETIFGTDSLFAPGGIKASYNITIEHALLEVSGQKIQYEALAIPASSTAAVRLRTIVSQQ